MSQCNVYNKSNIPLFRGRKHTRIRKKIKRRELIDRIDRKKLLFRSKIHDRSLRASWFIENKQKRILSPAFKKRHFLLQGHEQNGLFNSDGIRNLGKTYTERIKTAIFLQNMHTHIKNRVFSKVNDVRIGRFQSPDLLSNRIRKFWRILSPKNSRFYRKILASKNKNN